MEQLRIEISPRKNIRLWTPPDWGKLEKFGGYGGKKLEHKPILKQIPQKGFIPCPHCGGTAHEEPDGFTVVLSCINCGYNKPIGVALCTQTA